MFLGDLIGERRSCFPIIQLLAVVIPIILLLILVPTIPKSFAHASVINSYPSPSQSLTAPPVKVDVYFTEPVDLRYSELSVIDSDGKQVDNKDIKNIDGDQATLSVTLPSSGLNDGVYTVTTRVLSQIDGHVTDNAFVFGVGESASKDLSEAAGAVTIEQESQLYIPDAIARFPALVGQVIIVGSAFTALWLWRPISKINWFNDVLRQTRKSIDRRLTILMIIGSAILVISDFGIIYVQAASINVGISEAIMTKFGNVWIVRVVLSFVLLITSLLEYRKLKKDDDNIVISKEGIISLLAIGLVTLLTTSLVGHGAANGMLLPITIDLIHNLAASIWIGGVIYLALVVVPAIRKSTLLKESMKISLISIIIPRFSSIPVVILGVIIITGPSLLYILESNLGLTLASLYGKILIIKLLLATVMICIGGFNQFIVHKKALGVFITELSTGSNTQLLSTTDTDKNIDKDKHNKEKRKGTIWKKIRPSSHGSKNNIQNINSILSTFSKSLKIESIVGIVLLMSVAFLVNTGLPASEFQNQLQPNQQQQQQQQQQQLTAASISSSTPVAALTDNNSSSTSGQNGFVSTKFLDNGSKMTLSIDPFSIGNNNFKIVFADLAGDPIGIKSAQMKFNQIEEGIGPINVDTQQIAEGVFSADNAAFSLPGNWEVQVEGIQTRPNSPNLVAIYEIPVKPNLDQLQFNISEFRIPGNKTSQPLYPLYDNSRNVIWVGDTAISSGSGRIFEFDLNSNKFTEHNINGTNIITVMALDHDDQIWYVDPLMKHLGYYNPDNNKNQIYKIPNPDFIPSGIAIDKNNDIWLTSAASNEILRFNSESQPAADNNFTAFYLPSANATSLGITVDDESGQIWIAENIGKLANIDPTMNYKIVEYTPEGKDNALKDPTDLLVDPVTGDIYISEHEGNSVAVFDPILKKFDRRYTDLDPNGLPFGMATDKYGNLWVAEHTINKIAVIDPRTGDHREIEIPAATPFVQWITSDSNGNIWLAEQRGNALASVISNENLSQSSLAAAGGSSEESRSAYEGVTIPFGLSYVDIVGPSIAAGIVICTLFYTKSMVDFQKSMNQILKKKSRS